MNYGGNGGNDLIKRIVTIPPPVGKKASFPLSPLSPFSLIPFLTLIPLIPLSVPAREPQSTRSGTREAKNPGLPKLNRAGRGGGAAVRGSARKRRLKA